MTPRRIIGVTVLGGTAVVSGHDALMVLQYTNVKHRRDRRGWAVPIQAVPDIEAAAQVLGIHVSRGNPS